MAMASGGISVLDKLFEIVDSVSPTVNTYELTFNCEVEEGTYFIVSDPPGNSATASQQTQGQTLLCLMFYLTGAGTKTVRGNTAVQSLKTPSASSAVDYWTAAITVGDGEISAKITSANRWYFVPGFTYYLVKIKGM